MTDNIEKNFSMIVSIIAYFERLLVFNGYV